MIKKQDLKQIDSLRKEIKYIEDKINKIESKPVKVVQDSVSASSVNFPYTRYTAKIEGFENPKNRNKYRKILKDKKYSLEKKINNLEYELNKIEDSELRMIIRYKYEENYSWIKIMHEMEYDSESKARMILERFLEKL